MAEVFKILIVEDEKNLAFTLKLNLEAEGYTVFLAEDGALALEIFQRERPFHGIILDIMLPKVNGYDIAKRIREQDPKIGIMFLSALDSGEDRVKGLQLGVDDYVVKPFHLTELLVRLKRMVERGLLFANAAVAKKGATIEPIFELNSENLTLNIQGEVKQVTDLESKILSEFRANAGKVLSRKYLLEKVWNMPGHIETRTVDNFIVRLRKLIEKDPANPQMLKSVRGRGYKFCANPREEEKKSDTRI